MSINRGTGSYAHVHGIGPQLQRHDRRIQSRRDHRSRQRQGVGLMAPPGISSGAPPGTESRHRAGAARSRQALPGRRRGAGTRRRRRLADGRRRRNGRAVRAQRLGQDDAAADGRDAAGAHRRHDPDRRARRLLALRARGLALPALRTRLHPPELRPAAGRQRDRQRGAEAAQDAGAGATLSARSHRCSSASDWASACATARRRSRWASASG